MAYHASDTSPEVTAHHKGYAAGLQAGRDELNALQELVNGVAWLHEMEALGYVVLEGGWSRTDRDHWVLVDDFLDRCVAARRDPEATEPGAATPEAAHIHIVPLIPDPYDEIEGYVVIATGEYREDCIGIFGSRERSEAEALVTRARAQLDKKSS